jgi:hypothetical protein
MTWPSNYMQQPFNMAIMAMALSGLAQMLHKHAKWKLQTWLTSWFWRLNIENK